MRQKAACFFHLYGQRPFMGISVQPAVDYKNYHMTMGTAADRKFKRPSGATIPAAPSAPRQPARAARSKAARCATLAGAGQASQDGGEECLRDAGGMASRKATWDGWRGANAHAITLAQRDETPRRCVPIAPASTRDGVGGGETLTLTLSHRVRA
jgi:hypothetical protein